MNWGKICRTPSKNTNPDRAISAPTLRGAGEPRIKPGAGVDIQLVTPVSWIPAFSGMPDAGPKTENRSTYREIRFWTMHSGGRKE